MEQVLFYRGVRFVVGDERLGQRAWAIYPTENEPAQYGVATEDLQGSFKRAVFAARRAIDQWVDTGPPPPPLPESMGRT